jgi:methanethiol S-methyltransferase
MALLGEIFMNVILLCILWICWCSLHSVLIDSFIVGLIKKYAPGLTRYYRLLYNGLSLVTLVPLIILTKLAEGQVVFSWEGYVIYARILLITVAFLLFKGGAKQYDLVYFLGLKQLKTGEEHLLLSDTDDFTEKGVFGITRHPWYLGSILLIWSILPRYPLPVFLAVCILSIYLVVGTMLEERKIVAQYGDRYRCYRKRVSMLFPWKWLIRLSR